MAIVVLNQSTLVDAASAARMVEAVHGQLISHVLPAWGRRLDAQAIVELLPDAGATKADDDVVILFDDSDQAGALGYHSVLSNGQAYGRVFAKPTLDNGGALLSGAFAVSVTLSHEVAELFGDRWAGYWADDNAGALHALELCDAVESDAYDVKLGDGTAVSVSNFLLPAYFNYNAPHGPYDYLAKLAKPFSLSAGGYQLTMAEGQVSQTFGAEYPDWKKASKLHPASRTARRLVSARKLLAA